MSWGWFLLVGISAGGAGAFCWLLSNATRRLITLSATRKFKAWIWQTFEDCPGVQRRGLFWIWFGVLTASALTPMISVYFHPENFWITWEIVGLLCTLFFTFAMFHVWFDPHGAAFEELLTRKGKRSFFEMFWVAIGLLALATIVSVLEAFLNWKYTVIATPALLAVASYFFAKAQSQIIWEKQENLEGDKVENYEKLRRQARNAMWHGDIPTFVIFLLLFVFVVIGSVAGLNNILLKSFVGGAVGFQLLLSNFVFGMHYALRFP